MHEKNRFFLIAALAALSVLSGVCSAHGAPSGPDAPVGEELMLFQEVPSVLGASEYEQKVTEAPASVSIITASDIKQYGYRTLADILRSVRGFYVTYDRNYSYVGVRGFGRPGDYNSRILLLIDGNRVNDTVYNQALVGTEGILDVDLIDRVEVIRGPGSSLYGSNAFFAVVNVVTRRGRDLKGGEASGEAGSFNTYKGRLSYGDRFRNGVEALLSGTGYNSQGQQLYFREFDSAYSADPRATGSGITDHTDYDRYHSFFVKASFQDFTFASAYSTRTKGIPTGSFGINFNDPGNKTTDSSGYADLRYEHDMGKKTEVTFRLFYDYYEYTGDYKTAAVLNKDWGYGEWWGGEIKVTSRYFDAHRLIVGAEYTDNVLQDQKNYDTSPYALYLDSRTSSKIWAGFAQDEFLLARNVIINAGVRFDHYSTFGSTTNPRLALIYSPFERGSFKFLYGSAFRAPNVFELYYESPASVPPAVANPELKPETIKTYTLVYEQYFAGRLHIVASGYSYKIRDLIDKTTDPSGNSVSKNIEEVAAHGLEFELENKWTTGIDGRFSYTIQRTEDKLTGEPLTNSPAVMAKVNLAVPVIPGKVFVSIEEQYMSRRKTQADAFLGSFYLTNLTVFTHKLLNRLEVSASIYNVLNKKYGDPVSTDLIPLDSVQQDGRSYRLKLTYAF